jgi:hypothetical protein
VRHISLFINSLRNPRTRCIFSSDTDI